MNQNKLTFETEKLIVNWIGLKFQNLDNFTQKKLAKYLYKLGFNSYQKSGKLAKLVKESIFVSSDNKFQVLFVNEGPYWKGTSVHFSSTNAAFFYSFEKIRWPRFSHLFYYFSNNSNQNDQELRKKKISS